MLIMYANFVTEIMLIYANVMMMYFTVFTCHE